MGFFDSFRKNKNNEKSKKNEVQQNNIPINDIDLKYSSGTNATVNFGNVIDYDGKHLQEVDVIYTDDGKFVANKIYMDPHIGTDESGKNIYNTKEYFTELAMSNKGLVKGFFEKNSVNSMETNYIGSIGKDSQGKYNRSIDHTFLKKYKEIVEAQKEQKRLDDESKKLAADDKFRNSLIEETNSGYQNMCDNMDRNANQRLKQGTHKEVR
jgi:hypothetical protein